MKTYTIDLNGRKLTLRGLIADVKEHIVDLVIAEKDSSNERRFRKGLMPADRYKLIQQEILAISWISDAVIFFLSTPEGSRELMRAMIEETVSDAELDQLVELRQDPESQVFAVCKMIFDDAYPKKKTVAETGQISTLAPKRGKRS